MNRDRPKDLHKHLTRSRVLELLDVDAESGQLRWKVGACQRASGKIAGTTLANGYINVRVDGMLVRAHRLIWLVAHGSWPRVFLDHINGDRSDNRLCNLREATKSQNNANSRPRTSLGIKGVRQEGNRWSASMTVGGRQRYLGSFKTMEEAAAARAAAAKEVWGDFGRVAA